MPKFLVMPKIGMNMEEAMISEWLVKPGDKVEKDQMVLRAETDKAIQDIPAAESGIVYKLLAQEEDVVPCQEKIALLLEDGETYAEGMEELPLQGNGPETETQEDAAELKETVEADVKEKRFSGEQRISPLARKTAKELGISIESLMPGQEGKRIVKRDVLRYGEGQKPEMMNDAGRFVPYSRKRQVIGKRMLESTITKPRVTLVTTVDCENLMAFRNRLKEMARVSFNEIIAKACAAALRKYPEMNCVAEEEGIRIMDAVNIGIAVDMREGLLVPVLKDVDRRGIFELSQNFSDLVEKARNGALAAEEMTGGTFSISNIGMFGIESFNPIINPPECFILGVGCMKEKPMVVEHEVCIRTCMQISLSFDHKAFDGAAAAKLLHEIQIMLEDPILMLT